MLLWYVSLVEPLHLAIHLQMVSGTEMQGCTHGLHQFSSETTSEYHIPIRNQDLWNSMQPMIASMYTQATFWPMKRWQSGMTWPLFMKHLTTTSIVSLASDIRSCLMKSRDTWLHAWDGTSNGWRSPNNGTFSTLHHWQMWQRFIHWLIWYFILCR